MAHEPLRPEDVPPASAHRHPFDGINPAPEQGTTRRSVLRTLLVGLAGLFTWAGARASLAASRDRLDARFTSEEPFAVSTEREQSRSLAHDEVIYLVGDGPPGGEQACSLPITE